MSNLQICPLQPGQGGRQDCRGDVVDDGSVESEDVEGLQPEVLGVQQYGQKCLHPLRAEVEIYPIFSLAAIIGPFRAWKPTILMP